MDPVTLPLDGILDLHTFKPRDIPSVLEEYIRACRLEGIHHLRIIHGKGKGIQKARVHSLLASNPMVRSYSDAPAEAGGWGATLVELTKP